MRLYLIRDIHTLLSKCFAVNAILLKSNSRLSYSKSCCLGRKPLCYASYMIHFSFLFSAETRSVMSSFSVLNVIALEVTSPGTVAQTTCVLRYVALHNVCRY